MDWGKFLLNNSQDLEFQKEKLNRSDHIQTIKKKHTKNV